MDDWIIFAHDTTDFTNVFQQHLSLSPPRAKNTHGTCLSLACTPTLHTDTDRQYSTLGFCGPPTPAYISTSTLGICTRHRKYGTVGVCISTLHFVRTFSSQIFPPSVFPFPTDTHVCTYSYRITLRLRSPQPHAPISRQSPGAHVHLQVTPGLVGRMTLCAGYRRLSNTADFAPT